MASEPCQHPPAEAADIEYIRQLLAQHFTYDYILEEIKALKAASAEGESA